MSEPSDRIYAGTCIQCREPIWMLRSTYDTLKRSSAVFKCLWGHCQVFAQGKTDLDLAREELDRERRRRQSAEQSVEFHSQMQAQAERSARGYKGQATRLRNRAKAGICPCCKRHFTQLERHMTAKHPGFEPDADAGLREGEPPILSLVDGGKR